MLSLKEARTKRDELATLAFRGKSPARQKQLQKVALANASTVRDFCERYFAEVIQKDRKDATQLRRYLEKEFYSAFGTVSMRNVTAQDVQRLVFRKRDNGFNASAAQLRNLLKRVFRLRRRVWTRDAQSCPRDPDTIYHSCQTPDARALARRDQVLPGRALPIEHSAAVQAGLHIILLALVRKSELLHARWEHIQFDTGEWLIPEAHSKTAHGSRTPLG